MVGKQISHPALSQCETTSTASPALANHASRSVAFSVVRSTVSDVCTRVIVSIPLTYRKGVTGNASAQHGAYYSCMELKRYRDASVFEFGDLQIRELTPDVFDVASFAEIVVPVGADREPRVSAKEHRMYICFVGEIEFSVNGESIRLATGDVLHISEGETYGFHNGGYQDGRLLLIRVPGPSLSQNP